MIKRDELANPNSCLNKAADDEPLFVLRANDLCAPDTVRRWAAYYRADKQRRGEYDFRAQKKYEEAVATADGMLRWRVAKLGHRDGASSKRSPAKAHTKWTVVRRPVLQEDEGREFHVGTVEAADEAAAKRQAESLFGGGYFHATDFEVFQQ